MRNLLNGAILAVAVLSAPALYAACNANMLSDKPGSVLRDNGDGTVTDKETGLMWMKCSQGFTDIDCTAGTALQYDWQGALAQAQSANAGVGTNGYIDWRLPSVAELASIVESACASPSIKESDFPATEADLYWTSSPYAANFNRAWAVDFSEGEDQFTQKDNSYYVRLVRGGL